MKNLVLILSLTVFSSLSFAQTKQTKVEEHQSRSFAAGKIGLISSTASIYSYGIAKTYDLTSEQLIEVRKNKIMNSDLDGFEDNEEKIIKAKNNSSIFKSVSKISAGIAAFSLVDLFITQGQRDHERKNTSFIDDSRNIPAREISSKTNEKSFTCEEQ